MLLSQSCACLTYAEQSLRQEIKPVPHLEHQRRVNRVLTRSPPMDELLCITLNLCCQNAHKGNRGCASYRSLTIQDSDIEQFDPATGSDDGCGLLRNDPRASFRAGERRLERQHSLHMRLGGEDGGHFLCAEHEVNRLRHLALPFQCGPAAG